MDSFKSISISDLKDFKEFVPIYASSIIYFIPKTPHLKLVTRNTFIQNRLRKKVISYDKLLTCSYQKYPINHFKPNTLFVLISVRENFKMTNEDYELCKTIINKNHRVNILKELIDDFVDEFPEMCSKHIIKPIHKPIIESYSQITPYLYLGGIETILDDNELDKRNIKYIINCAAVPEAPTCNYTKDSKKYVCENLPIYDNLKQDISQYFTRTFDIISKAEQMNVSVLVHCYAGISRSATIVIAYLMMKNKLRYSDALDYVKSKRSCVSPNLSFTGSLILLEQKLFS